MFFNVRTETSSSNQRDHNLDLSLGSSGSKHKESGDDHSHNKHGGDQHSASVGYSMNSWQNRGIRPMVHVVVILFELKFKLNLNSSWHVHVLTLYAFTIVWIYS